MKALDHLRVLDLSRVLASPFLAQNLADFGADVIKVEQPHRRGFMQQADRFEFKETGRCELDTTR